MNMMKPFFVALLILAMTMATLTPAVRADDDGGDDNTDISIRGWLKWYIKFGRHRGRCDNTYWGKKVCPKKGPNLTCCKHNCVDLSFNKYHCGSCGALCPFPKQCCGKKCVNVNSDPKNCSKCGKICKGKCIGGQCNYAA